MGYKVHKLNQYTICALVTCIVTISVLPGTKKKGTDNRPFFLYCNNRDHDNNRSNHINSYSLNILCKIDDHLNMFKLDREFFDTSPFNLLSKRYVLIDC